MTRLSVAVRDGAICVVDPRGRASPILLGGQPVRGFEPGWSARGACDSFAPWTILDLAHTSGRDATWLLGNGLNHWSSPIASLSRAEQEAIAEQAAPAIRAIHQAMLCAARPSRPPELAVFDGLNRQFIIEIMAVAARHAIGDTRVVDLHGHASPDADGIAARAADGAKLRLRAVAASVTGNFQHALQAALTHGYLTCPSPVDGIPLYSCDSMVLHEHRIAYRFVDARYGLVFYISTTDLPFAITDLFIPSINTAFLTHPGNRKTEALAQQFLAHAISDATLLLAYLDRGDAPSQRPCAVICRGHPNLHMGHQVWNELTALDRLVREVPPEFLPVVIIPNAAQGSEVFAPVDRIFPEFKGRVDRTLRDPESLGAFVYRQGYCAFRALDEHVTQDLARRIRDAAAEEQPNRDDARLAARIEAGRIPCVVFGLRVENRTAIDPAAVIGDSVEHLRKRLGPVVVVIDGHNARLHHDPACLYDSFGQGQHEPPIFTELRVVMALRQRFENTEIEIVNLCGAAMTRSLFWGRRADFFVAFWGAGLAKYRWVCNRPGLVLSSARNLLHRGDLDIYHAPRYQEAGAPIRFIDAAHITDRPDAPLLFAPVHDAHYSNFSIDRPGLMQELDAMIAIAVDGNLRPHRILSDALG